jgi:hypothetical protein
LRYFPSFPSEAMTRHHANDEVELPALAGIVRKQLALGEHRYEFGAIAALVIIDAVCRQCVDVRRGFA